MTTSWQRLTLRARLLVIGVLGVAVALAIGSAALYAVLTLVSYRTLDDTGRSTAAEVADLVTQGRLPDPVPVTGDQVVQVVDAQDRVLSASVNADRLTAILRPSEQRRAAAGSVVVEGSRVGLSVPLRVVVARVRTGAGTRTVVVGQRFDGIEHSQHILGLTLLVTYPLLLTVLALIAWRVVGATLAPVELLRASADRISGSGQSTRLPVSTSGDEIAALAGTLNSMLDRLGESRARQRSFVADAAHELRSPLTSMQTQLEVAEHLGEGTALTADLRAEVARMAALVEDLLVLARLDADSLPPADPQVVPTAPLVRDAVARHASSGVDVTGAGDRQLVVRGDPAELARALDNLVTNAVRHARSRIEVRADAEGPSVVLSVRDDGEGISSADRERVFERFTRLDEGRARDSGGAGLGLPIVQALVARNGGTVALTETPGGGLTVSLSFPRPG